MSTRWVKFITSRQFTQSFRGEDDKSTLKHFKTEFIILSGTGREIMIDEINKETKIGVQECEERE